MSKLLVLLLSVMPLIGCRNVVLGSRASMGEVLENQLTSDCNEIEAIGDYRFLTERLERNIDELVDSVAGVELPDATYVRQLVSVISADVEALKILLKPAWTTHKWESEFIWKIRPKIIPFFFETPQGDLVQSVKTDLLSLSLFGHEVPVQDSKVTAAVNEHNLELRLAVKVSSLEFCHLSRLVALSVRMSKDDGKYYKVLNLALPKNGNLRSRK